MSNGKSTRRDATQRAFWADLKGVVVNAFVYGVIASLPAVHFSNGTFDPQNWAHIGSVLLGGGFTAVSAAVVGLYRGNQGDPATASTRTTADYDEDTDQ